MTGILCRLLMFPQRQGIAIILVSASDAILIRHESGAHSWVKGVALLVNSDSLKELRWPNDKSDAATNIT